MSLNAFQDEIQANEFSATYDPDDNKLRFRAEDRLSPELYALANSHGFKWAPLQKLFVAPAWSPAREDFLIELAGTIEPEETTLTERAEAKAERLAGLVVKREAQSGQFADAARRISERFAGGQPILVGHHSERKARKDHERMDNEMRKAVEAQKAAQYWEYRARGVASHANSKQSRRTRANRIKTLLADLRKWQRDINHVEHCATLWAKLIANAQAEQFPALVSHYAGAHGDSGAFAPYYSDRPSLWSQLDKGDITPIEAAQTCLDHFEARKQSPYALRWINHILNRLEFERSELGLVQRFDGELTPVILQGFARTHGAHKPKAVAVADGFTLSSSVTLPLHIADANEVTHTADEWRDIMQACGYTVEVKAKRAGKAPACPLINPTKEDAEKLQAFWNSLTRQTATPSQVIEVSQAYYSANSKGEYSHFFTIELDKHGRRIFGRYDTTERPQPVCRVRVASGAGLGSAFAVVVVVDKPAKSLPSFEAINAEETA